MVEEKPSNTSKGQVGIIVGNPTVKRGTRLAIVEEDGYLIYGTKSSIVFRHVQNPNVQSLCWSGVSANDVTACAKRPGSDNEYIVGDAAGMARHVQITQDGTQIEVLKEFGILGGKVCEIGFTDDGKGVVAFGEGPSGTRANAVQLSNGNKMGDIQGSMANNLTGFVTPKPYTLISAGESKEILKHVGTPFKGIGDQIQNHHDDSKFISRMAMSPNQDQFASVGLDKQIIVYDSKSFEKKASNAKGAKMGIMDCCWYDDEHLVTCSADNKVKVWEVKDGAIANDPKFDLMQQATEDKMAKIPKQLVGCWRGQGGEIGAVNLEGDLLTWNPFKDDMAVQRIAGCTDLIRDVCMFNGVICHASQGKVFYTKGGQATRGQHIENPELLCEILYANSHSLYAILSGADKKIIRMTEAPEGEEAALKNEVVAKLAGFGKNISGDDQQLFILLNTGEIAVHNAETLVQTRIHKCAFANPIKMVYSCHTGHLWVADKKGCIHILKSDDFSEVGTFAKHTQAVNVMTVSKDGKQIASGDSYRYTYVCDAESMLDTAHYAFHPASILDLSFSDDGNHLATVATDMSFALIDLQAKTHKQVKNPHFDKKPRTCMVMPDGKVATSGEDCAIRIWNLE